MEDFDEKVKRSIILWSPTFYLTEDECTSFILSDSALEDITFSRTVRLIKKCYDWHDKISSPKSV